MENKKLSFAVDASNIDIKPLLKKDFLELSIRAISSANPNRNGSWFTRESMERSIPSFANKPILGYFENDDFVSHNGEWSYDEETDTSYWDTLGRKGERMLGLIRESDEVKIVQGKDGLDWVEITCALWVQYSFKQVKRLLKDAKRAKANGGVAKNVSVEVDITDYEFLPNGVMKINEFNLVGITILGSRNGVKVEPGIENAGLSVVDVMGRDVFEQQKKALRLAYEKLEKTVNNNKEEFPTMDNEVVQNVETQNEEVVQEIVNVITQEENPTEGLVNNEQFENGQEETQAVLNVETQNEDGCAQEEVHQEAEQPEEKPAEGKDDPEGHDDDQDGDHDDDDQDDHDDQDNAPEGDYDGDHQVVDDEDYCGKFNALSQEHAELVEKYEKICQDLNELQAKYDSVLQQLEAQKDYEELKNKVDNFEHQEFLNKAKELINFAKFDEENARSMFEACEKREISTLEDLKIKVALKAFELKEEEKSDNDLNSPVIKPKTTTVFEDKSEKTNKKSSWDALREYNNSSK